MKLNWLNKKNSKIFSISCFFLAIGFIIMAFAWKYASYGVNENPNFNNNIGFIVQFYISISLIIFSLFFALIWLIIYIKEKVKPNQNNISPQS
ncbi:hypothetical protein SHM_13590 [Spiroplasma ixodetis]|uniref:DUF3955 domain-containing protein n=1 Tax=Spiroplasma ixodetis TaxID=2141 RepID=A0ABN6SY07_9MOLU|nr:hypothetical protein SHM_13590 [Spiroplasma ixodetis]